MSCVGEGFGSSDEVVNAATMYNAKLTDSIDALLEIKHCEKLTVFEPG